MRCTWQSLGGMLQGRAPPRTAWNIMIWVNTWRVHGNNMDRSWKYHDGQWRWRWNTSSLLLYLARVQSEPHLVLVFINCGVFWGCLWMVTHESSMLCLVMSGVWCLGFWYKKAPSPFFSLAISPKPCRAHRYHLGSNIQGVVKSYWYRQSCYRSNC